MPLIEGIPFVNRDSDLVLGVASFHSGEEKNVTLTGDQWHYPVGWLALFHWHSFPSTRIFTAEVFVEFLRYAKQRVGCEDIGMREKMILTSSNFYCLS